MICKWDELLKLLPADFKNQVAALEGQALQEVRLRLGQQVQLRLKSETLELPHVVTKQDIQYVIDGATNYSPWSAESAAEGYITACGGHRIGIAGIGSLRACGISKPLMLNIRIACCIPGVSKAMKNIRGNVLIMGPPGSGKTTVLRDYIFSLSSHGRRVAVVDERQEIFPYANGAFCFPPGKNTDVLQCVPKPKAALMLLRTMNPEIIAMDELTAAEDASALQQCYRCGVDIVATAHANDKEDFLRRHGYRDIREIFHQIAILTSTQDLHLERI